MQVNNTKCNAENTLDSRGADAEGLDVRCAPSQEIFFSILHLEVATFSTILSVICYSSAARFIRK